ncbi:energy-coupling factor ABC transporter ATP-binding protein [Telmatospirillum sp. J64-1]|uniref:energy-coupling factor ABC transporter ATP-binding protein n=1 Tax=Telmatospirillum sp. J64-1 TaxID=2502183 RepID=UPI00115CFCE9|nr:ABC transporter ATP-binding protein [Telmatospirillum sp. J64-1]
MADLILAARGLTYSYGGSAPALDGLDLDVTRGRKLAILGPNGAGKSTLLLHLNGTLRPARGEILLDGVPVGYGRAELNRWRARVGLVLQDPDDQLFAASVYEDVSFGPVNLGLPEDAARRRTEEALEAMRIAALAERPPHLLSFGQKKRAAIAGILAMRPDMLLLDEPTAGLDSHGERHLLAALDHLVKDGATIVFTTHDVDLAYGWADEVALFSHGRVLGQGEPAEMLGDEALLRQARLHMPLLLDLARLRHEEGYPYPSGGPPRSREAFADWMRMAPARSGGG